MPVSNAVATGLICRDLGHGANDVCINGLCECCRGAETDAAAAPEAEVQATPGEEAAADPKQVICNASAVPPAAYKPPHATMLT